MGTVRTALTSQVGGLTFNYPLRFENFKGRSEMWVLSGKLVTPGEILRVPEG